MQLFERFTQGSRIVRGMQAIFWFIYHIWLAWEPPIALCRDCPVQTVLGSSKLVLPDAGTLCVAVWIRHIGGKVRVRRFHGRAGTKIMRPGSYR